MLSMTAAALSFAGSAPLVHQRTSGVVQMGQSQAFPGQSSPDHLEGMIGNVGFDPWGLSTPQNINWSTRCGIKSQALRRHRV